MKSSIVIPCYNESKNIPLVLARFKEAIKDGDIELIIVNNGSTDDSSDILAKLLPTYPFAGVVKVDVNQGYGFGILSGLRAARGECLAWTHADMQTDPYDVITGLSLIEKSPNPQKTFVKGTRKSRPLADLVFTYGMNIFESLYFGTGLTDINAQPNIFHRSFFESWNDPPHDYSLDLYAFYLARKKNLDIIRFPVLFKKRMHGQSHWNFSWSSKWKFIKRTIAFTIKLKRRLK